MLRSILVYKVEICNEVNKLACETVIEEVCDIVEMEECSVYTSQKCDTLEEEVGDIRGIQNQMSASVILLLNVKKCRSTLLVPNTYNVLDT